MIRLLTTLSAALFLAACATSEHAPNEAHAPAPTSARQLSGAEIHQVLIGRKLESVTEKGEPFWEVLSPGGAATIKIAKFPEAEGSWKVSGDVICVTYKSYGRECNTVRSDGVSVWLIDEFKKTTNNMFSVH